MDVTRVPGPTPPIIRVRALANGYTGDRYRQRGDVFEIDSTQAALAPGGWMELAPHDELVSADAMNQLFAATARHVEDVADPSHARQSEQRS